MKLPLIYIAGPFRGPTPYDVRRNVERARDAGWHVASLCGGYPVIPHTMTCDFDKLLTDEFWLAGTMEMLRRCDAVFMVTGWPGSRGATAERAEAQRLSLPVFDVGDYELCARWVEAWKANR